MSNMLWGALPIIRSQSLSVCLVTSKYPFTVPLPTGIWTVMGRLGLLISVWYITYNSPEREILILLIPLSRG